MKTNVIVCGGLDRRNLNRKMLKVFCAATSIFAVGSTGFARDLAHEIPISVISGTSGSLMGGQSYNETRAVDVTVLSPDNLLVQSMTLNGIDGSGPAEAVIYDSDTGLLIASAYGTVTGGAVTVPISATLLSDGNYTIGFFGDLSDATVFEPAGFPYVESSGLLEITGALDGPTDSYPSFANIFDPQISMQVTQVRGHKHRSDLLSQE